MRGEVRAEAVNSNEWNFVVGGGAGLFEKLDRMPVKLENISHIFVGLQTSADTVFLFKDVPALTMPTATVYSKELGREVVIESALLKPVVRSGDIGRYWANPTAYVLFPYIVKAGSAALMPERELKKTYPLTWAYLVQNKRLLSEREHGKFKDTGWYQLYPKNLNLWEQPKILIPYMIQNLAAYADSARLYFVNVTTGGFGITIDEKNGSLSYFTGLLNSRVLDWFLKRVSTTFHGGYFGAGKQALVQLPIRPIDFSDKADKARHDRMVQLVNAMLALHGHKAAAKTVTEQEQIQRQLDATDRQIDALVYELYGLTAEEIAVVEGKRAP